LLVPGGINTSTDMDAAPGTLNSRADTMDNYIGIYAQLD
jgi:hypothetical protein